MTRIETHELRRCLFCETNMINKLKYPMRDFEHVEEMCVQLYLDALGHGINKEFSGWKTPR